jgi:hypothetical protein
MLATLLLDSGFGGVVIVFGKWSSFVQFKDELDRRNDTRIIPDGGKYLYWRMSSGR